ncbi:MAG: hypothetical protein H6Q82_1837, partial [Deltaproteobacteria bacterium]|nr:hypothetical protein [Deltaproteobacteria bacterium]
LPDDGDGVGDQPVPAGERRDGTDQRVPPAPGGVSAGGGGARPGGDGTGPGCGGNGNRRAAPPRGPRPRLFPWKRRKGGGAPGRLLLRAAGRGARAGGADRRGEEHALLPAPRALPCSARHGPPRGDRCRVHPSPGSSPPLRPGRAGPVPLLRLRSGERLFRPGSPRPRRREGGDRDGPLPRRCRGDAERVRHGRGGAGDLAVGGTEAASHDRPGPVRRSEVPSAGRRSLRRGRGDGAGDLRRDPPCQGGADGPVQYAPDGLPLNVRPDPRAGGRPDRRGGDARRPARAGRIVEEGTHGDLLARRGTYFDLYSRQMLARELEESS